MTTIKKNQRKAISKKTRFEVFKRDKFTCQFCGNSAPSIVLEIDHLKPISKGGNNGLLNLITSCFDCNRGKSKAELSDDSAIKKQVNQLGLLQEKRNQLNLMSQWREEMEKLEDEFIKYCEQIFRRTSKVNWELNELGRNNILKLRKKYADSEIFEVCEISFRQYYLFPKDASLISEQWNKALNYIPKILSVRKRAAEDPDLQTLYYCRGILRNKVQYKHDWQIMQCLKDLRNAGYSLEDIKDAAINCYNWSDFQNYFRG